MQLFVRAQQQHVVDCEENDTVGVLRVKVAGLEGIDEEGLRMYANGSPLEDNVLLSTLSTQIIEANVALLGGKVHGSLARAGKVKGQTPKVEKQEKKKKKTGRAKRRFQYNRRFVNVVQGFGRKRGPNAAPIS